MPLMTWTKDMSVGVTQFDTDHQKLLGMLNELFDGLQANKGREALGHILDGLIDYTKVHFAREEEQLKKFSYLELAEHQREHRELTTKVMDIQKKYHTDQSWMLSIEVMVFLRGWLSTHIRGTDKKYGPFLNSKGIK